MEKLIFICVGAVAGALLRWSTSLAWNGDFPWGTLAVNALGCFLATWFWQFSRDQETLSRFLPLVLTGFMGSFTTFSAFSLETLQLWSISPTRAASYFGLTIALTQAAAILGFFLGSR